MKDRDNHPLEAIATHKVGDDFDSQTLPISRPSTHYTRGSQVGQFIRGERVIMQIMHQKTYIRKRTIDRRLSWAVTSGLV